jgi:hypothetical protein
MTFRWEWKFPYDDDQKAFCSMILRKKGKPSGEQTDSDELCVPKKPELNEEQTR